MRLLAGVSAALVVTVASLGHAQSPKSKAGATAQRANELTLAGLRPGWHTAARAVHLFGEPLPETDSDGLSWAASCAKEDLTIRTDHKDRIESITVARFERPGDCVRRELSRWHTGLGLRIGDAEDRVLQIYGKPDSRSPSSNGGQTLELLYYAFDWAGPDVPQIMTVLCTLPADGKPGRVVEITLVASSL